jgi:hypothetical protein
MNIKTSDASMISTKQFRNFVNFIKAAGAQLLEPTNEYEALRFKANAATGKARRRINHDQRRYSHNRLGDEEQPSAYWN